MYSRTPFYDLQKQRGAYFKNYEEFQYELPANFGSAAEEHIALSKSCSCIDFSYYGNLRLTGKHAQDFMNRMSTNDLKKLNANEFASSVLTNEKGRIIDLIVVYRQPDGLLITVSPKNCDAVISWLDKYIIMDDVKIQDISGMILQLGLIGRLSSVKVSAISQKDPPDEKNIIEFVHDGHRIFVARSHQIADGFLLMADAAAKESLWNLIASHHIGLCGMEAYTAARIMQSRPILRRELSEKYNPLEAGLTHAVSFSKGCYIGQEVIARLDAQNKVSRHLVKVKSEESIPENSRIMIDEKEAGIITSSSYSYSNEQNVALGYVKTEFTSSASPILLTTSDNTIHAEFSS